MNKISAIAAPYQGEAKRGDGEVPSVVPVLGQCTHVSEDLDCARMLTEANNAA
ncbi:MAG: hypothetical protein KIS86_06430 [Devosia sp.]|nr:hypothetical protein [Devosia sp.]